MSQLPGHDALHEYRARLIWEGGSDGGTRTYAGYGRRSRIEVAGKPALEASADPMFRGDAALHNPEDLFVASISACHMLTYLALCARNGIQVVGYEDDAIGAMELESSGSGRFTDVLLRPSVTIAAGDPQVAAALHEQAHACCFIANSCRVPIRHDATVTVVRP